jgi:hypothetical protein
MVIGIVQVRPPPPVGTQFEDVAETSVVVVETTRPVDWLVIVKYVPLIDGETYIGLRDPPCVDRATLCVADAVLPPMES